MHLAPHLLMGALITGAAAWLMLQAGFAKGMLEQKHRRVCPSCGKHIKGRVCSTCTN